MTWQRPMQETFDLVKFSQSTFCPTIHRKIETGCSSSSWLRMTLKTCPVWFVVSSLPNLSQTYIVPRWTCKSALLLSPPSSLSSYYPSHIWVCQSHYQVCPETGFRSTPTLPHLLPLTLQSHAIQSQCQIQRQAKIIVKTLITLLQ